jgi:hypothetical protein
MGYRTMSVRPINRPDAEHLENVKAEMLTLGSPTIRVADAGDFYVALGDASLSLQRCNGDWIEDSHSRNTCRGADFPI